MKTIFDNIKGTCEIDGEVPSKMVCEYDAKSKILKVARDKIGEQSLYYSQLPTAVVVSTELKDILPHIAYPKINMLNLAQPMRYNYPVDLQQTWIEQIKRVRAGEELTIDQKGIRSRSYWMRDYTPTFTGTQDEALKEALRLLRKSVKEGIESAEGPVAVLLSGGIDSTSLAALTKEIQGEVHVISAGYKGNKNCDERPVAKRFAEEKGLIYHEIELDVKDFQSYLNEMMPYLDEPCFDINCMVQYALYKKAAEMGYKTILCGLGGDELFYSYALRHREVAAIQLRHQLYQLYPVRDHKKEYARFVLKHWRELIMPNRPAMIDESMLTPWTYADYTRFAKDATLGDERFADIDVHVSFPENTTIQSMYDFVASTFAVNMCVYMAKKLSQANGVTVLLPFINPEFVEFMDSLPMEIKFDMNEPKMFQKKMMTGIIPDYILYAAKRGFTPPFDFILQMNKQYKYKHIEASYCFYNSMVADMMMDNLLF